MLVINPLRMLSDSIAAMFVGGEARIALGNGKVYFAEIKSATLSNLGLVITFGWVAKRRPLCEDFLLTRRETHCTILTDEERATFEKEVSEFGKLLPSACYETLQGDNSYGRRYDLLSFPRFSYEDGWEAEGYGILLTPSYGRKHNPRHIFGMEKGERRIQRRRYGAWRHSLHG